MTIKTPADFAAFLETLRVKKPEGPDGGQHQWPLDAPIAEIRQRITDEWAAADDQEVFALDAWDYFEHRCAIAESNAKPDKLVELVKAAVRAGMDAENKGMWDEDYEGADEFRKLSEAGE